jgi:hypothetical protein
VSRYVITQSLSPHGLGSLILTYGATLPPHHQEDLRKGAAHQLRGRLAMVDFDRRIVPTRGLDNVILPADIKRRLVEIVNYGKVWYHPNRGKGCANHGLKDSKGCTIPLRGFTADLADSGKILGGFTCTSCVPGPEHPVRAVGLLGAARVGQGSRRHLPWQARHRQDHGRRGHRVSARQQDDDTVTSHHLYPLPRGLSAQSEVALAETCIAWPKPCHGRTLWVLAPLQQVD